MPTNSIPFSQLASAPQLGGDDIYALSALDTTQTPNVYVSYKTTLNTMGTKIASGTTFNTLKTHDTTLTGAINETISNLADDYDNTSTYAEGDCVLYDGGLYKCIVAITTAEEWDSTHWQAIKAVDVGSGGGGSSGDHITLTQAEYDALVQAGTVDPDAYYFIEDGSPSAFYEKTLYSNVDEDNWVSQADGTVITLSDDITQFDEVRVEGAFFEINNNTGHKLTHFSSVIIPRTTIVNCLNNYADSNTNPLQWQAIVDAPNTFLWSNNQLYSYGFSLKVPTTTSILVKTRHVTGWEATKCGITKIVGIKYDVVGGNSNHNYSTDEQIVGTWIDGKTLYEKTIAISQSTSDTYISLADLSIDTIIFCDGFMQSTNGDTVPIGYLNTLQDRFQFFYNRENTRLYIRSSSWAGSGYLIIRYTKVST